MENEDAWGDCHLCSTNARAAYEKGVRSTVSAPYGLRIRRLSSVPPTAMYSYRFSYTYTYNYSYSYSYSS